MNEQSKERELDSQVSALVDGEVAEPWLGGVAERIAADPELARRWSRYHLIGEIMRGNHQVVCDEGLHERVREALAGEPARLGPRPAMRRWRPIAGLALAATVAGIAVLIGSAGGSAPEVRVAAVTRSPAPEAVAATARHATGAEIRLASAPRGARRAMAPGERGPDPRHGEAAARLNAYLINHAGYLGGQARGVMPYARIISYEGGR